MCINPIYQVFVWNFVFPELRSNSSLQGTFYRVPREIVRAGKQSFPNQYLRFSKSEFDKPLEVGPIGGHHTATAALMCGCGS